MNTKIKDIRVREDWGRWEAEQVERGGFENRPGATELEQTADHVSAYVSDNRWVAACPACAGGIAVSPAEPDGCCYDCGHIYRVDFPPRAELSKAIAVLEKRPPQNRHWRPAQQTVDDLKAENALHGFDFTT